MKNRDSSFRRRGARGEKRGGMEVGKGVVVYEDIISSKEVLAYLEGADRHLEALGYTEHGLRHCKYVGNNARRIMVETGRDERGGELACIGGVLHDIGNVFGRFNHASNGAVLAHSILHRMGMPPEEIRLVANAIANHDEETGEVTNDVTAAVILADKSDVHRSRVRNPKFISFDIHDRVNYACTCSHLKVDGRRKGITLELLIDTEISRVLEYFEIFLTRMLTCKKAAEILGMTFEMVINDVKLP